MDEGGALGEEGNARNQDSSSHPAVAGALQTNVAAMKAWIDHIPPEKAQGALRELYDRVATDDGVDHIVQIHSLVPRALDAMLLFYKRVMHGDNDLPLVEREIIAVTVSVLNRCHY